MTTCFTAAPLPPTTTMCDAAATQQQHYERGALGERGGIACNLCNTTKMESKFYRGSLARSFYW